MVVQPTTTRPPHPPLTHPPRPSFALLATDLHDDGGENGDNFLNRIQPIAATMPYMTAVGECACGCGCVCLFQWHLVDDWCCLCHKPSTSHTHTLTHRQP